MKSDTLRLVLTRKWFNMILCGEKKEEYRDYNFFWIHRIFDMLELDHLGHLKYLEGAQNTNRQKLYLCQISFKPKKFEFIEFALGYAKDRPVVKFKLEDISIGKGVEKWGAEKNKIYIVLRIGKQIGQTLF